MTVTEAKEIKNLLESIETAGKMRESLSKPKSALTLNIQNTYDYMGTHYTELKADALLQERIVETIEQYEADAILQKLISETIEKYEQELIEELSRYSLT